MFKNLARFLARSCMVFLEGLVDPTNLRLQVMKKVMKSKPPEVVETLGSGVKEINDAKEY